MYLTNPDDDETEALANELVEHGGEHAVESYHGFGLCYAGPPRRQGVRYT